MSGDCRSIVLNTAHVLASNPNLASVYPMSAMVERTMSGIETYVQVVISPATHARPVVTSVSQATRAAGSSARIASRTPSEIWSAILSGWPSVTDSAVKRKRSGTRISSAAVASGSASDREWNDGRMIQAEEKSDNPEGGQVRQRRRRPEDSKE